MSELLELFFLSDFYLVCGILHGLIIIRACISEAHFV